MKIITLGLIGISLLIALPACKKNPSGNDPVVKEGVLDYGDSIFYLKAVPEVKTPKVTGSGTYEAFPDDLLIDPATGSITVARNGKSGQSQAGLRYRIKFTPTSGTPDSTYIVISGLHYQDKVYKLTDSDPLIHPIYNADVTRVLPNGIFYSSDSKLVINSKGEIDFKASVNNGFFSGGSTPNNEAYEEVYISYKLNDASTKTDSTLLLFYYFDDLPKISANVANIMKSHQDLLLGIPKASAADLQPASGADMDDIHEAASAFKPKPPCIIIVGH